MLKPALLVIALGSSIAAADPTPTSVTAESLREQAIRVATERVAVQSHAELDISLAPYQIKRLTAGGRVGKLEGGAAAATFVGEMILAFGGSPLAALGALATGATLDAAAADAEASTPPTPSAKLKPRPKHTLR
jgi:hypothetical protein